MYASRFSTAHPTIYLIERALALPVAIAVILFADFARMPNGAANFLLARVTVLHVLFAGLFIAAWIVCFPARAEQQGSAVALMRRFAQNLLGVLIVTGVFGLLLLKARTTTPLAKVLPLFLLSIAALTTARLLVIAALDSGLWRNKLNVIILGTGPIARRAWRDIRTKHYRSAKVIGFVDDQCLETALPEIRARHLGPISSLETMLLKTAVDLIVIALPTKSCYGGIQTAIGIAEEVGVDVLQFESVFSLSRLSKQKGNEHEALYSVHRVGQVAAQVFKRLLDVVLSAAGIIVLSPLLIATAIAIKITDPGPALFVQERYGYRRRKFKLFKFRTMVVDAERMMAELEVRNEADGPIFKMKNDPRVTRLGRLLRKTSLDELPQLLNVLIGDMSLVGPRPMSLRDVGLFSQSNLMRRFNVKPGITGLWQVSGRSNTSFDHWISMDFRYIDDWSFWLDLSILARTIPVVLKGSGAM
jgi:exopolysaccharide biosynthesis polyprenyl glycosylphosphotransferase